mmetsp:Transcript_5461/g.11502  ORF Transcript_5461/g.11502 Transcript_5461/m.11502 type:complete len:155 (-) Transcript_5461:376-840(-)
MDINSQRPREIGGFRGGREMHLLARVKVCLFLRTGATVDIELHSVKLPFSPTVSELRLALLQTELASGKYDAFLQKWARISYVSTRDVHKKIRRLDSDSTLSVLIRDELREPGTVTFCVEQCRNPRFSKKQRESPCTSEAHDSRVRRRQISCVL